MNLWAAGRRIDPPTQDRMKGALEGMLGVYPQLSRSTLCQRRVGENILISMTHSRQALGARRPVWAGEACATLYEGTLVHPTATGCDAESLSRHWSSLPGSAEGQFAVVRAHEAGLEVLVDPLGMEPVFAHERNGALLLSNSVAVIAAVTGCHDLDPVGASTFLAWGWTGGDHTLNQGIRVLPGGLSRWEASGAAHSPAPIRHGRRPVDVRRLADDLMGLLRRLPAVQIEASLTAGKDTRVMAALLMRAGVDARFFTGGPPEALDARTAVELAARFRLTHELRPVAMREPWETVCDRLLGQCDGMLSLWQLANVADEPASVASLPVRLSGVGGEIARGHWTRPGLLLWPRRAPEYLRRWFCHDHGGLLTGDAVALARGELDRFQREHPVPPLDLMDQFCTQQLVRRWCGANARKSRGLVDRFTPFVTRPFMEAAFALSPGRRAVESLHHDLLRLLHPELHAFPLAKPWRRQNVALHVGLTLGRRLFRAPPVAPPPPPQRTMLDRRADELRAEALDQSSSPVWNLLSRRAFEQAMKDPSARAREEKLLWTALTLLAYADPRRRDRMRHEASGEAAADIQAT